MEKNGIIRRIDDLGRIVIPREYRRLHGIDLGDPMEITALENGEIVIRKADTSGELVKNFIKVCSPAASEMKATILLSDGQKWLHGFGALKGEFVGRELTRWAAKNIRERQSYPGGEAGEGELVGAAPGLKVAMQPALSGGDCFGAIYLVSASDLLPVERALCRVLAAVLGEYMRRF